MALEYSRRNFVKQFVVFAATSIAAGTSKTFLVAGEISASAAANNLQIKLSDYPALQEPIGSVRIGISGVDQNDLPKSLYPLIVNRVIPNTYYVLDSACRHEGCVVEKYVTLDGAMTCPCHNSKYNLDGSKQSGPASSGLLSYPFTIDGDLMTIEVPGMGFTSTAAMSPLDPAAGSRFVVKFNGRDDAHYELLHRALLTGSEAWSVVPFATTTTGPADQTVFVGQGAEAELYLTSQPATGFYRLRIKVREV